MARNRQELWLGLLAIAALTLFIAGIPVLLIGLGSGSLPNAVPSVDSVSNTLTRPLTNDGLITALGVVCWLTWFGFVISVIAELIGWAKGSQTVTMPVFGAATRRLLLTAALLFAAGQRPDVSLHQRIATEQIVSVAPEHDTSVGLVTTASESPAELPTYTVAARDDLWSLAQRHLGDPFRWQELFELNKGRTQPDGTTMHTPDLIRPGWTLQFPADAVGLAEVSPSSEDIAPESTVESADVVPPEEPAPTPSPVPPEVSAAEAQVPVTTEATDAPSADTTSLGSDDDVATPVNLAALGLVGFGAIAAVDQLRRRRLRHRPIGTTLTPTPEALESTEVALRVGADASQAHRLDVAGRALAHCLASAEVRPTARVQAVRVTTEAIEYLFDSPVIAPTASFAVTANQRLWTLPRDVHEVRVGALAAEISSPMPAMVQIGSSDGADVLIDLEVAGVVAVTGTECAALGSAIVTQLTTSEWADHVDVVTIGMARLPTLERLRSFATLAEAAAAVVPIAKATANALTREGIDSTFYGRATQEANDGWIPTVVILPEALALGDSFDELTVIAGEGGKGLVVVIVGPNAQGQLTLDSTGGSTTVRPPDIELTSLPLDEAAAAAIDDVVIESGDEDAYDSYVLPDAAVDVREPVTVPPVSEVTVNVLGRVEITGGQSTISRSRSVEAVAYLALHPKGVGDDRFKTALWPEKAPTVGTFNTTVSLARRQLGDGSDGQPYVLPITKATYGVSPLVGTDLGRLEILFAQARQTTTEGAITLLTTALEMVRGRPFDETKGGYHWAHVEGWTTRAEALVADAAHHLAELHLARCDARSATWAARQGLLASPGYEVLYRDLMLACQVDGNVAALESIMAELGALLDVVDPSDSLESETMDLYNELRRSRAATNA